jgi:hypothetical protein
MTMAQPGDCRLPESVASEWAKLEPLVAQAETGLDYDQVAEVMGWTRDYAKKRLGILRLRYRLPIPTHQETGCWGKCPECGATLNIWLDGRWCADCGWDEGSRTG